MTNTDPIKELERQNAELRGQVAVLAHQLEEHLAQTEQPVPPAPKPHRPRPVTIVQHAAPRAPDETLPNDQEFARLQEIVLNKYPMLQPRNMPMEQFSQHFVRAFCWLLIKGRMEGTRVATDKALVFWLDQVARYHNNQPIAAGPFCAAAVACGDVNIASGFTNLPYDVSLGLADFYRAADAAGWRRVLDGKFALIEAPLRRSSPAHISFR